MTSKIIESFEINPLKGVGMPIGNLTSQIFANIHLNELDRFIKHMMKPLRYLRYGDDFIVVDEDLEKYARAVSYLYHDLTFRNFFFHFSGELQSLSLVKIIRAY